VVSKFLGYIEFISYQHEPATGGAVDQLAVSARQQVCSIQLMYQLIFQDNVGRSFCQFCLPT